MTSEQVMLTVTVLVLCGCAPRGPQAQPVSPRPEPTQLWAVAPLRNESGSAHADGLALADHLARQFETAAGVDVLPVNRTLAAMAALALSAPASPQDALKLLGTLDADALVVGTVTAYDPYDPPKLGLALELYVNPRRRGQAPAGLRELVSAAVDRAEAPGRRALRQPVGVVSALFDAGDASVRALLKEYVHRRGRGPDDPAAARLHWISMDLFSQFVSHEMSRRLLETESRRLTELTPARVPGR